MPRTRRTEMLQAAGIAGDDGRYRLIGLLIGADEGAYLPPRRLLGTARHGRIGIGDAQRLELAGEPARRFGRGRAGVDDDLAAAQMRFEPRDRLLHNPGIGETEDDRL